MPRRGKVTTHDLSAAAAGITDLDWKVQDVVIAPVEKLPNEADPGR